MLAIEILILIILLLIFGAICFGVGFFVARKVPSEKAKPRPLPLDDKQQAEKARRERFEHNFRCYDGSEQTNSNT